MHAKVINFYLGIIVARSENNQEKFKSVYAFVEMLNFIHTNSTPNIKALCLSLFMSADCYQLEDLKSSCVEEMISILDLENMCSILILSKFIVLPI